VLCEKPLGVTMEEMQAMIDVCDKQGAQLMTSFPCRYLPAVAAAKEAIGRGEIGEIVAVKGMNRGTMPGQWFIDPALSGGGAVLDHTVHVMDLLNWLLNSPVTEVCAEAGTLFHDIPVEDAGIVHVKFASGASAVIDTSWSRSKSFHSGGDVMLTIVGTEGVISVDALAQKNEVYSDDAPHSRWSCWGDSMDAYLVKAFVDALRQRREVPITGEDGLRSAQVALAAYASIRSGRTVKFIEGRFAG
jgi:predicted dehydrogenase